MGIGKNAAEAALDLAKNETVLNKASDQGKSIYFFTKKR